MKKLEKARDNLEEAEDDREKVPWDIIPDILRRLPLKSLVKCKVVNKHWYGIIKSPELAKLRSFDDRYLRLSILPNQWRKHFLILTANKSLGYLEYVDVSLRTTGTTSILPEFVVNECNGLSLLAAHSQSKPGGTCIIFNHITGRQVPAMYQYKHIYAVDFGLGYCPVSEQFKILRIVNDEARIQTLGSKKWRVVENAPASYPRHMSSSNKAFLHSSLHRYSIKENIICCFDFETERFWQMSTPDGFQGDSGFSTVSVFNSCLCLTTFSYHGGNKLLEIWVMKEYGVKDSWVKQFVIPVSASTSAVVPLFEMDSGESILFTSDDFVNLESYDIQSKTWYELHFPGIPPCKMNVIHHANSKIMFPKFQ